MYFQVKVNLTPNTSNEGDKRDSSIPGTYEATEQILTSKVLKLSVIQIKIW